jgi:hypothetical protein
LVAIAQIFNNLANDYKETFIGQFFLTIEPKTKLTAYEINFFASVAIFAKCKKYLKINENPPSTQEAQLSFLLNQFQATDIKIAFANAIGKVGSEAQTIFYPLPLCKDKLISRFS